MDKELSARNSLTGWMALVAFLAAYRPLMYVHWLRSLFATTGKSQAQELNQTAIAVAGAVIALVGTPFLGFIAGGLLNGARYLCLRGAYSGEALRLVGRLRNEDRYPQTEREKMRSLSNDEYFYEWFFDSAKAEMMEWCRRRRTGETLGLVWTTAGIAGLSVGAIYSPSLTVWKLGCVALALAAAVAIWLWPSGARWWATARWFVILAPALVLAIIVCVHNSLFWIVAVIAVFLTQLYVGRRSKEEADNVEYLWAVKSMNKHA